MSSRDSLRPYIPLILLWIVVTSCGISRSVNERPDISAYDAEVPLISHVSPDSTYLSTSEDHLYLNEHGLWEMTLHGDPLQLGHTHGLLAQHLLDYQEKVFFDKVKELVPSEGRQRFLRKFLAWYNRKMYKHVPDEYRAEILGLSEFASDAYSDLAPPYLRVLYLHGAHDIGHAVQDLALVGCSSFAAWGDRTQDGELIIGRNFDFYAGDGFAENKLISFVSPAQGHRYMSIAWPGMIGVVSGMNEQGLTVTMNAGKSSIPLSAKTPISLLAREILQYASTIAEAQAIADQREVFVSEALMIGSAKDGKAALLELSPKKSGVVEVEQSDLLICTNHFQSDSYRKDKKNRKHKEQSHSVYRYEKLESTLQEEEAIAVADVARILRDRSSIDGAALGNGNELALNQLQAHHGIIFKPESRQVWISAPPYQLGAFVAYDLDEVFAPQQENGPRSFSIDSLLIPEDPFIHTEEFEAYMHYREERTSIQNALTKEEIQRGAAHAENITTLNPDLWEAYYLQGRLLMELMEDHAGAADAFSKALELPIPDTRTIAEIEKLRKKCIRKAK